jgi:hypothetical protein
VRNPSQIIKDVDDPRWIDAIVEAYEQNGREAHYQTIYAFLRDRYAMAREILRLEKTVQRCVQDYCPESDGFKGVALFRHVAPGRYRLLGALEMARAAHRETRAGEYTVPLGERVPDHRHATYVDNLIAWFGGKGYAFGATMKKDAYCDLVVLSMTAPKALLFEAKSACGPYDLYCALGQLFVNRSIEGQEGTRHVVPVLAFPTSRQSKRTSDVLRIARDSGITVITYDDFDAVAALEASLHE